MNDAVREKVDRLERAMLDTNEPPVRSSELLDGKEGEVSSLETRHIVQCQSDSGDWYDFSVCVKESEALFNLREYRRNRPATYRAIRRKILDVIIAV